MSHFATTFLNEKVYCNQAGFIPVPFLFHSYVLYLPIWYSVLYGLKADRFAFHTIECPENLISKDLWYCTDSRWSSGWGSRHTQPRIIRSVSGLIKKQIWYMNAVSHSMGNHVYCFDTAIRSVSSWFCAGNVWHRHDTWWYTHECHGWLRLTILGCVHCMNLAPKSCETAKNRGWYLPIL